MRKNTSINILIPDRGTRDIHLLLLFFVVILVSCKKYVEINPPTTEITRQSVYANDASAISVLISLYTNMSSGSFCTGKGSISMNSGLSADEFTLYSAVSDNQLIAFYRNSLSDIQAPTLWQSLYKYLLSVNSAIEGLTSSNTLTPLVKQQLLGEAKFLRAFYYFYLVNLYGDVPLILTSDWRINEKAPRMPKTEVYQQMINDLKDAQDLLSNVYVGASTISSTSERVRPNKWAATALLARVYLYMGQWTDAETQASAVIGNTGLYGLENDLNNVFIKNRKEAIWQLQPVNIGWNTEDARVFFLSAGPNGSSNPVYLSSNLLGAFETGDRRRMIWADSVRVSSTTYYYPYKYKIATSGKPVTEYLMVLRMGEQYLVRAEARAHLNILRGAIDDLDMIRSRAGLPLIANTNPGIGQSDLLAAILHERQVELFSEWGNRWLDTKRTGAIDLVMPTVCAQKGGTWKSYWQYYPLMQSDVLYYNLTQTPGY